ncbi:MAG: hypothetical protein HQK61_03195 [Desulfamplus sp.]|nr:hypothetical protein [Desulfamplus sp.]
MVVADLKDIEQVRNIPFAPPFFVKPLSEGTGKGITAGSVIGMDYPIDYSTTGMDCSIKTGNINKAAGNIRKTEVQACGPSLEKALFLLTQRCTQLLEEFKQPVLVEKFLPGREFTVGIAGTGKDARVLGTMEILLLEQAEKGVYSFVNKEDWKKRVAYRPLISASPKTALSPASPISSVKSTSPKIPANEKTPPAVDSLVFEVEKLALESWKVLECRDGGRIDIRCDENGIPCFIEVNPLAGLRPGYSDLPVLCSFFNISYLELIRLILDSASKRIHKE